MVHDLRCGMLRWRYFITIPIFLLSCLKAHLELTSSDSTATWGDYLLYCFRGRPYIEDGAVLDFQLPVLWLLIIGGCLFLNFNYFLNDLTKVGQQIIVRSNSRVCWYLSKCCWNFLVCVLYVFLGALVALVFSIATGGVKDLSNTPEVLLIFYNDVLSEPMMLTSGSVIVVTLLLPVLTLVALNMLEMTLCLFVQPVISFIVCMSMLMFAAFWKSPLALGIGAMAIRSSVIVENGIEPIHVVILTLTLIGICIGAGCWRFRRTDIFTLEE